MDEPLDGRAVHVHPAHPLPAAMNDSPKQGKIASALAPIRVSSDTDH
jgi:hypothetical protein